MTRTLNSISPLRPSKQRWYLRDIERETGAKLSLTPEAERQLQAHSFPGNIEELFGLVRRAATQSLANGAAAAAAAAAPARSSGPRRPRSAAGAASSWTRTCFGSRPRAWTGERLLFCFVEQCVSGETLT